VQNLFILDQTEIRLKVLTPCVLPTYDFLLTLHSNNGPVFSHTCVFAPPRAEEFALESDNTGWPQLTRIMGLSGRDKSSIKSLSVWMQYTSVTDRQMDRQTDTGRRLVPRLRTV